MEIRRGQWSDYSIDKNIPPMQYGWCLAKRKDTKPGKTHVSCMLYVSEDRPSLVTAPDLRSFQKVALFYSTELVLVFRGLHT